MTAIAQQHMDVALVTSRWEGRTVIMETLSALCKKVSLSGFKCESSEILESFPALKKICNCCALLSTYISHAV